MRRIVLWLASTVTIVVLLFGYHTSTNNTAATSVPSTTSTPTPSAGTSSSSGSPPSSDPTSTTPNPGQTSSDPTSPSLTAGKSSASSPSLPSSPGSQATKTYTGSVAQTRWGPVQVKITVTDGKITKVTVLQQPDGNPRDTEINNHALPILIDDTIKASSANIDMVSGATVTSEGYLQSLQAAIDQAGI